MSAQSSQGPISSIVLLGTLVLTAIYFLLFCEMSLPPFEDAAMLIRYSQNWADGYGIVWNPGEAPLDGATDFLFMAWIAMLMKIGLPIAWAAKGTTAVAHLLTVAIVFRTVRKQEGSNDIIAAASAFYLAIGPGLVYVESWFGTTFFALFALLAWIQTNKVIKEGFQFGTVLLLAIYLLLTGLSRPEGVILGGFMLISMVYARGIPTELSFWKAMAIGLLLPGITYFIWRWNHFGHPLPNPFYIKGGGMIHLHSLKKSILHLAILALPMLPAFVLGFIKHETTRKTIRLIIPVLGFTIIWILMSNAMNYFMRFQYVLLPIIMVSWWPLVEPWIPNLKQQVRVPIVLVIVVLSFGWQYVRYGHNQRYFRDGRQELGTELAKLGGPDLKMAVTEAGNLPLSSGWTALDTWGLNDHQIPKDGVVSVKQLYEFNPDLVMIHDYKSPKVTRGMTDPDWSAMVDAVEMYVTSNDFELLAAFGASPDNSHYYYVRRTSNKYKEIMKVVVKFEYYWYETGERCVNYAENADL